MGRDAKCPRCDFKAPTVAFLKAADDGAMVVAVLKLPASVQGCFLAYFSLFRPSSGCAVSLKKATRLTLELADLVNRGFVKRKASIDRSCPPRLWAIAMEQMIERAATLTLPLKTHGYLKTIAYDLASKEDSGQEQHNRSSEARGQSPVREKLPDAEKTRRALNARWEKEQKEWEAENADKLESMRESTDDKDLGTILGNFTMKGMG